MDEIRRYKVFDPELHEINNKYISPTRSGDDCKQKFTTFLQAFKLKLCEVEPFLEHFKLYTFQGSSYEGLSVGKSYNEFDINVHIKLDSNVIKPDGIQNSFYPGFVTLKMDIEGNHARNIADRVKVYKQWMNKEEEENYLYPNKFYRWGESVIDRTILSCPLGLHADFCIFTMKVSKSGPAFTLHVTEVVSGVEFDVDIVFALSFDNWHLGEWNGLSWVAVAKRPKTSMATLLSQFVDVDFDRSWRYSFYNRENQILSGYYHLKNTIRLLKKVRDSSNMSYLASYYIKTLFMWEVKKRDPHFWNQSLGYLFVTMLYKLKNALEEKTIPFYFDERHNLLSACDDNQLSDGYRRLNRITIFIERICDQKTPHRIRELFVKDEDEHSNGGETHAVVQQTESSSMGWLGFGLAVGVGALAIAAIAGHVNRNRRE